MEITRLSSKGQIIIPQVIREAHQWHAGDQFQVINVKNGILLTPLKPFKTTSIDNVLGCTGYKGKKKSLQSMKDAIKIGASKHK